MKLSILVVENHHDLRSAIVAAVNRENLACEAVRSGEAALVKLRSQTYDYILVDDDDATAAAALLDDLASHPDSPKLVLLTEFDRNDDLPFLRKPFDSKQLLAKFRR
ncbi:MAG TPA: response regulator [Rhodanobacteraceae bacterium]